MKLLLNLLIISLLIPVTAYTSILSRSSDIYPKRNHHTLKSFDLEELTNYFQHKTNGLIYHPVEVPLLSEKVLLNSSKFWDNQIDVTDYRNFDFVQNYFTLDILGFINSQNVQDFNSAKITYYKNLRIDPITLLHEKPYYYLEPWGLLNHPPIKKLDYPLEVFDKRFSPTNLVPEDSPYFDPNFHYNLDKISNTNLTYGNEVKLLANSQAYDEKLRLIREAKSYIFASVMTFWCDSSTKILTDELIRRAKEGVDVKIITEAFYGKFLRPACISKLKKNGVEVLSISDLIKAGGMMHNKFWIRDGIEGIVGGQNIVNADNNGNGFNGNNRDTDILFKGPATTDLTERFIAMWNKYRKAKNSSMDSYESMVKEKMKIESDEGQRGQKYYSAWLKDPAKRMNGLCRVAVQGAKANPISIAKIHIELIKMAKQHLLLTSPTIDFNLKNKIKHDNDLFIALIKKKAQTENLMVDVLANGYGGSEGELTIMLKNLRNKLRVKGKNFWAKALDKYIVDSSLLTASIARKQLLNLTNASSNIRSWEYFQYIHSKQYLYDHIVGSVGSWNLDMRSANKGHETQIFCQDSKLVLELENQFILDMANSIPTVSANNQ